MWNRAAFFFTQKSQEQTIGGIFKSLWLPLECFWLDNPFGASMAFQFCCILSSFLVPWNMTISVFVYICPPHCERYSAHIVRIFPSSFRCVFDIVAHNVASKSKILQYIGVRSFSQFLIIFIVHSIQFFIVSSKISKFLKLDQNWRF